MCNGFENVLIQALICELRKQGRGGEPASLMEWKGEILGSRRRMGSNSADSGGLRKKTVEEALKEIEEGSETNEGAARNLENRGRCRKPIYDHLDLFHHNHRVWNEDADALSQKAREEGPSWNNYRRKKKFHAIRILFDEGVCYEEDQRVSRAKGWLMQITNAL